MAETREARKDVPVDRPQEELEAELLKALRVHIVRGLVIVLLGTLSGVLLIVHPLSGRMLAVTLCSLMLLTKLASLLSTYPHIGQRLHALFFVVLPWRPVYVIHNDLIASLFYVGTVVTLLRSGAPNNALQRTGFAGRSAPR